MFADLITPVLRWHLTTSVGPGADALVFTAPTGALLRRRNFRHRAWLDALSAAELPAIHFHDRRHTGNQLTAVSGANLRELIARMGHSSTRAALIYLHCTDQRQREIAAALNQLAKKQLKRAGRESQSGTQHFRTMAVSDVADWISGRVSGQNPRRVRRGIARGWIRLTGLAAITPWTACLLAIRNQRILTTWNNRQADNARRYAPRLTPINGTLMTRR